MILSFPPSAFSVDPANAIATYTAQNEKDSKMKKARSDISCLMLLVFTALAAGRADGVFISPRHSQVEMKGNWYPELQRTGKETRCHWMSGTVGESATRLLKGVEELL